MFIKKIKSPKGETYLQLAESYRDKGKVRHKALLSLGKAGDSKIDSLVQAVSRYSDAMTMDQLAEQMDVEESFILGPLLILEKLFKTLGINQAVEDIVKNKKPKVCFDIQKILFSLVVSRFVSPGSKLKVYEHLQNRFYPGLFSSDIKLHQIYRALDFLSLNKEEIERSLYWHGRDLFNQRVDVVLYDLTTLRFESRRTDLGDLRQFGYSKERRGDMVQVVLGLLVNGDGFPLGFEVYPGNTFEGKTVAHIEKKLRKKFNVGRFIFVGDRGLFSKKNLQALDQGEGEFIVGMKLGSIKNRHKEFYNKKLFKKVQEGLFVYETEYEGKRLIITWSAKRAERDRKARAEVLLKIKKKLSSKNDSLSAKDFITNESYKKYVCLSKEDDSRVILNKKAINEEIKKEGFFGVITNVEEMSVMELVSHYKELWKVEDAFGELKGTLEVRPVFHWTDKRIVGHLVICFIAYMCEAYLTKELRRRSAMLKSQAIKDKTIKSRPLTVAEGMLDLLKVCAVPIEVKDSVIWLRTKIKGNAEEMFRAGRVQIPKTLLKFCKGKKGDGLKQPIF